MICRTGVPSHQAMLSDMQLVIPTKMFLNIIFDYVLEQHALNRCETAKPVVQCLSLRNFS